MNKNGNPNPLIIDPENKRTLGNKIWVMQFHKLKQARSQHVEQRSNIKKKQAKDHLQKIEDHGYIKEEKKRKNFEIFNFSYDSFFCEISNKVNYDPLS